MSILCHTIFIILQGNLFWLQFKTEGENGETSESKLQIQEKFERRQKEVSIIKLINCKKYCNSRL